jgi:hypothetical protein
MTPRPRASREARWLGVQVVGQSEEARVLVTNAPNQTASENSGPLGVTAFVIPSPTTQLVSIRPNVQRVQPVQR